MSSTRVIRALYRGLAPPISAALPLVAPFSAKLRNGLAGRRGLDQRIADAAEALQGCVWVHVTSVGEYEQARPIIAAIRAAGMESPCPVAVTHFSPSGLEFARQHPCADHHDYLPFDTPVEMRALVRAWRPRLLIFVKFDCWPHQVLAAKEMGVPVILLAGTLQPRSLRLRAFARPLFRDLFDRFDHLGVCTTEDRERFVEILKVRCPVTVTGDTRAEQVILRYEAAADGTVTRRLQRLGGRLLVLGSTWPPDEALWLPVLPDLLSRFTDLRVILVPHEPTPERLAGLAENLAQRGIPTLRLSSLLAGTATGGEDPRCVLVDSIGVLADIYRAGAVAYVGGSFTTGVHNTMEPAVAALPVLFGPRIQNAGEAGRLVERGAGFVVTQPPLAAEVLTRLLGDRAHAARCGASAREVVLDQRGATQKSLALIRPYL